MYSLTNEIYFNKGVEGVEFSYDGNARHYVPLLRIAEIEKSNQYVARPSGYFLRGSQVGLSGIPNVGQGKIRVRYTAKLLQMDKRRGRVASTTDDGTNYTTIVLESSLPTPDTTELTDRENGERVSIIDNQGVVQHANIPYNDYDSGTRTLTLDSGVAIADGVIAAGDYITYGAYSSSHSDLPDEFEPFLVSYAKRALYGSEEASADIGAENNIITIWTNTLISVAQSIDCVYQRPAEIDGFYT